MRKGTHPGKNQPTGLLIHEAQRKQQHLKLIPDKKINISAKKSEGEPTLIQLTLFMLVQQPLINKLELERMQHRKK